jgi:hypothetical protein
VKNPERRSTERNPIKRAIATFTNSEAAVVGHIVDIGKGGIAFLCKNCQARVGELVEMDILFMDSDVFLPKVACTIIDVEPCAAPSKLCWEMDQRVACTFRDLDDEQAGKINHLYELAKQSRTTAGDS